jgi:hypothetical protein
MSAGESSSESVGRLDRSALGLLVAACVLVSVVAAIDLLLMLHGG